MSTFVTTFLQKNIDHFLINIKGFDLLNSIDKILIIDILNRHLKRGKSWKRKKKPTSQKLN